MISHAGYTRRRLQQTSERLRAAIYPETRAPEELLVAGPVDRISLAEASAGAAASDVGFVPLNVLVQAQAGPLTRTLGVLPDPAVLVYRRPGDIVARFDGFADRDTVAQAAANAALTAPAP